MQFFNHYSTLIMAGLALVSGILVLQRRGGKASHWLIFGGVMVALIGAWMVARPQAVGLVAGEGRPVLLELQSPYCLACVAIKPAVDRIENEWRNQLAVRRVNVRSADGRELMSRFRVEYTPTFIFFDATGQEQWRSVGQVDDAQVRSSLAIRQGT